MLAPGSLAGAAVPAGYRLEAHETLGSLAVLAATYRTGPFGFSAIVGDRLLSGARADGQRWFTWLLELEDATRPVVLEYWRSMLEQWRTQAPPGCGGFLQSPYFILACTEAPEDLPRALDAARPWARR